MPFFDAYELIAFALKQACEENLMNRWIASYQTEMGFDEFKQKLGIGKEAIESKENIEDVLLRMSKNFG